MDEQIAREQAMRRQTENYVVAVYTAHPELMPEEQRPIAFDKYPKVETVSEEVLELIASKEREKERNREVRRLCDTLEKLDTFTDRFAGHKIARSVVKAHKVPWSAIISGRGSQEIVIARHHAMFEVHRHTKLSLPQIGKIFNRDHSTVHDGVKAHQKRIDAGFFPSTAEVVDG